MRTSRVLPLVMLALGCQAPPDISGQVEMYGDLLADITFEGCYCPELLGFSSLEECRDVYGFVTIKQRECFADALEGHEDAGQANLDCVNPAMAKYLQCIEINSGCDESAYNDCVQTWESELAACPQLPTEAQAAFTACAQ